MGVDGVTWFRDGACAIINSAGHVGTKQTIPQTTNQHPHHIYIKLTMLARILTTTVAPRRLTSVDGVIGFRNGHYALIGSAGFVNAVQRIPRAAG